MFNTLYKLQTEYSTYYGFVLNKTPGTFIAISSRNSELSPIEIGSKKCDVVTALVNEDINQIYLKSIQSCLSNIANYIYCMVENDNIINIYYIIKYGETYHRLYCTETKYSYEYNKQHIRNLTNDNPPQIIQLSNFAKYQLADNKMQLLQLLSSDDITNINLAITIINHV